jgi:phage shock protein E
MIMNYRSASLVLTLLVGVGFTLAADHTKDTPEDVKKALAEKKAVLIDVREQKEWDEGHLKDADLLPLSKIKSGVPDDELAKKLPKGKIIYVHCRAGSRSLTAADLLKKKGIEVRALKEGYEDLLKSGLPKAEK